MTSGQRDKGTKTITLSYRVTFVEPDVRRLSYLTLALPLLLAFSSSGRTADDKAPETPYFPLKVGDSWTYKMGDTRYTRKVAKFEDVDKQPCALIQTMVGNRMASSERVAVKADGVYRYTSDDNKDTKYDPPLCFLKLPVKTGESWKVESSVAGAGKVVGTFKTGEVAELKVGDKKYEKVVTVSSDDYDAGGTKIKLTYYFAKDVGIVKQTVSVEGQEVVMELEKFEAGK
jgi:hypothetical protein